MKNLNIFTNGIIKSNPLLVLMIGLCSALAVTTNVLNGLGMGLAMTFVIVMSELIISIFRKHFYSLFSIISRVNNIIFMS